MNSRYANAEYFEEIDNFILDYANENYLHLLCGNFNSHTGIILDYVMSEDGDDNDDDDDGNGDLCEVHHILSEIRVAGTRYNQDVTQDRNSYG